MFGQPPDEKERSRLQVAVIAALASGLVGLLFGFYIGYLSASRLYQNDGGPGNASEPPAGQEAPAGEPAGAE